MIDISLAELKPDLHPHLKAYIIVNFINNTCTSQHAKHNMQTDYSAVEQDLYGHCAGPHGVCGRALSV